MKNGFFLLLFAVNLFAGQSYNKHQLPFFATVNGYKINFDLITVFLLKGDEISIKTEEGAGDFKITSKTGALETVNKNNWKFIPDAKPAIGYIVLQNKKSKMKIQYILMVPLGNVKNGVINGYRIGQYPEKALWGNKLYNKPRGLIEVTAENKDLFITPHFRLGQFLCKQPSSFPKYIVLRDALLYKLEYILEELNEYGYAANTLYIMSGYRTPYYNKLIGNVKYSRHVYGDAADIFVDTNHNENMDDLNRDGEVNYSDVQILADIVEKMALQKKYSVYIGGLGKYHRNRSHPGFIHTDVRGYRARW
jgi:hypothetical protein